MSHITYAETQTRKGARLVLRSYENGRGCQIFLNGECVGSIDRGSWDGHAPLILARRYPSHPTMDGAVAAVLAEFGATA